MSYHRSMVHSPTELATSLHSRGDLWRLCEEYPENSPNGPSLHARGSKVVFIVRNLDREHLAEGLQSCTASVSAAQVS
ncbi:CobW C-terminal domain-containing protein [Saccharopolyspora pogona]|uniref:GTP-binding protein n=1 Tax=Saccharopolyspora pogona TaxID=333966 RepID=UPI001CC2256D|nr:GTP-binding protein [Saccharopolyspora pogona]